MATSAMAQAEPVSLLIWMEDSKVLPILPTQSLPRRQFEAALKTFQRLNIASLKSVFIGKGSAEKIEAQIDEALSPDDTVVNLILATHGATNTEENKTELTDLGGFGEKGSFGRLHELLEYLTPHFSSKLHISLDACSTACGTKSQCESRVRGLASELSALGVEQVSVWGATQNMAFGNDHEHLDSTGARKQMLPTGMLGSAAVAMVIGAVAFHDYSSLGFAAAAAGLWGSVGAGVVYGFIRLYSKTIGPMGLLTISRGGHTETISVNAGTFDSLQPTEHICDLLLEGK
jgi:hypothetical protein